MLSRMAASFWAPRPNLIESDAGFSVEILGRTRLRYVELDRVACIDSEALSTPGAMVVYRHSIRSWESPHDSPLITETEREKIVDNIRLAFESLGYALEVI
jgi:immunity protein 74 of polymorphic toxin system